MPSPRQIRLLTVFMVVFIFTVLWKTSSLRNSRNVDFYTSTSDAMAAANAAPAYEPPPNGGNEKVLKAPGAKTPTEDEDEALRAGLKKAADEAKRLANEKAPLRPDNPNSIVGVGSASNGDRNVAGRKKYPIEGDEQVVENPESKEDHEVETELNSILKRSPIIIFSKSYCPHSKRAKGILLDKYSIKPAPFVVELDQHPLGAALQARLAKMTGRSTVPNVLINGKSIGGGDDVAELDVRRELINTVKSMGGKRMTEVIERTV